ncbi:MAG: hypothetical protein LBD21_03005 [Tannerellaceae bacterium]|jgi:phosphohistidine swiveling domain-containing protein|nr:hypothetical protein [Tannerellaceae bacterium]
MRRLIITVIVVLSILPAIVAQQTKKEPLSGHKEQALKAEVSVVTINNHIKVSNAAIGSKLEIYSIVGIKVYEAEIKQESAEYVVNIARGYYIIRIGEAVCKIAIR